MSSPVTPVQVRPSTNSSLTMSGKSPHSVCFQHLTPFLRKQHSVALGPRTPIAGPLERFSIRNWIRVSSVTIPDIPSASISLTICPLAMPPLRIAAHLSNGLQFMVTSNTLLPILAARRPPQPAWPAPTTITSYLGNMAQNYDMKRKDEFT